MQQKAPAYHGDEIAIIGMACRFPGSADVDSFWHNLREGVESITFFSREELAAFGVEPQLYNHPNYVAAKGVIEPVDTFDAEFFSINPREAELMDPQQRIFLEVAWHALEDAGYAPSESQPLVGAYAGVGRSDYWLHLLAHPEMSAAAQSMLSVMGNSSSYATTRASYKLGLTGPSLVVQTACSSSLVAVHLACQSLLNGECDLALAGGVRIGMPGAVGYMYQEGGIASPDGHCRAFDAQSQGCVAGDGVGLVVLKRLDAALADGDTIHAVIKGSAINNDGAARVGLTAPSVEGQVAVITDAQTIAQVDPETITYIEAHGTATALGDTVEIGGLTRAFRRQTQQHQFCAIGSVKTNIGHLDAAAGVAGLIKTVLALKHQQIPPSLHFKQPNPKIDFASSPFYVNQNLAPWQSNGSPRRAGVSSFGLGGTNAHIVLEEAPPIVEAGPDEGWQLLPISAKTATALDQATDRLRDFLRQGPEARLSDVAYTLQHGRKAFGYRRIVVGTDAADLAAVLDSRDPKRVFAHAVVAEKPPVTFMFSGQGSQYVGMGQGLYAAEEVFRQHVDRCCLLLKQHIGRDLREVLYAEDRVAAAEALTQTELAQPALFVVEYALAQLWMSWGVKPQAMIGHSIGEYVAACLAGVFSLEDGLRLVAARGRLMQSMPGGAMLSIPLPAARVTALLREGSQDLALAAVNAPQICVVSGSVAGIEALEAKLHERQVLCRRLHTSHAFHSPIMNAMLETFGAVVRSVVLSEPQIPYISNLSGTWITAEEATTPEYWVQQLRHTVRFADGIATLARDAAMLLLEVGPGTALTTFARQQAPQHSALASMRHPNESLDDQAVILTALGRLWINGCDVSWPKLWQHRTGRRISLPTYPFERQRYWIDGPSLEVSPPALGAQIEKRADLASWTYLPSWKRTLLPATTLPIAPTTWLLLCDEGGLVEQIGQHLLAQGHDIITVQMSAAWTRHDSRHYALNPVSRRDVEQLVEHLDAEGVLPGQLVIGWGLDPLPEHLDLGTRFDQIQERALYPMLWLVQLLGERFAGAPLEVNLLTNQAHAIESSDTIDPDQAPALGAALVIGQEYANVRCRSIDLSLPTRQEQRGRLIKQLGDELLVVALDNRVAYRGRQRWVQTMEPAPISAEIAGQPLRANGVYLITGGLGEVGLALATYLAQTVQARLVLLGRSGLPEDWPSRLDEEAEQPESDRTLRRIRQVRGLEALGSEVLVIEADVADELQMRSALSQTLQRFGALHGVIHAAGLTGWSNHRIIQDLHPATCMAHFKPKVHGSIVLARVLDQHPLDFCLLCSSIATTLGGVGFAAYAAANSFVDAFAHQQSQISDTPWISVNWDGWRFESRGDSAGGTTSALAALAMTPDEGVEMFRRIVGRAGAPQVIVSTGDLVRRLERWVQPDLRRAALTLAAPEAGGSLHARPALSQRYVAPETMLERVIASFWQEILGIEQVGIHDSFFELGGHSLIALQLLSRIRESFQVDLPLQDLFDQPTVGGMVAALTTDDEERARLERIAELLVQIAEMSEEDAAMLLSATD